MDDESERKDEDENEETGAHERGELVDRVLRDLSTRERWDTRQAMLYEMRFRGLRRKTKPWPGASDVHWPLADSVIEKLKPFYVGQLYATDQLALFVADAPEASASEAVAVGRWFDYQLRQRTDFEGKMLSVIDWMLMSGRPALKVIWDEDGKKLQFDCVAPFHLILPAETTSIEEADRLVHVQVLSVEAYKRNPLFRQDEEFIRRITGRGTTQNDGNQDQTQRKYEREGLTYGANDQIVVWEAWTRCEEDGKWMFETLSPLCVDEPIRACCGCEYDHGLPPFVDFPYEVTDGTWYSPRGVTEILAVFEAELCKLLNEKNDAMTLYNRPLFRAPGAPGNIGNLQWKPGQILPFDIQPVEMPQPPFSFDQQALMIRDIAERLVSVPDFGMSQMRSTKDARSATEISAIQQSTSASADVRMRIFRRSLQRLYRMAWSMLVQYAGEDAHAWCDEGPVQPSGGALSEKVWRVIPSGSADGLTRQQVFGKAAARLQMFANDPFVDQGELRKSVLEADDAGLVKRLFRDPGFKAATQAEDQAQEISILRIGFPAVVEPGDDHAEHIRTIAAYVMHQMQLGQPPKGSELAALMKHAQEHLAALEQQDPKAAKQAREALMTVGQMLAQQQQQGQQGGQPAGPGGAEMQPMGGGL
jgi:hypothetical protein